MGLFWNKHVNLLLVIVLFTLIIHAQDSVLNLPECVTELGLASTDTGNAIVEVETLYNTQVNAGLLEEQADALYCWGMLLYSTGTENFLDPYREARNKFGTALNIYRGPEVNNLLKAAQAQHQYGRAYYVVSQKDDAFANYSTALNNARSIGATALQGDIYVDLGIFYFDRSAPGDLQLAMQSFNDAYEAYAQAILPLKQANTLLLLGDTQFDLWQVNDAIDSYQRASWDFEALGMVEEQADALFGIARIYHVTRDIINAEAYYREALDLYGENNIRMRGRILSEIGDIYIQYNDPTAGELLSQAFDLNRQAGDSVGQSITLSYQGELALAEGNYRQAIASFNMAFPLADNNLRAQALAYHGRGIANAGIAIQQRTGNLRDALNDFGNASRIYRDLMGDIYSLQNVFISEGLAWYGVAPHQPDEYETIIYEAINKAQELGDKRGEIVGWQSMARITFERTESLSIQQIDSNLDTAIGHYQRAANIAEEIFDPLLVGDIYLAMGDIELLRSSLPASRNYYTIALNSYQSTQSDLDIARALSKLGVIEQRFGNYQTAYESYTQAMELLPTSFDGRRVNANSVNSAKGLIELYLGTLFLEAEVYNSANEWLDRAKSTLSGLGDQYNLALVEVTFGELAYKQKQFSQARSFYNQAFNIAEASGNLFAEGLAQSGLGSVLVATKSGTNLQITEYFDRGMERMRVFNEFEGIRRIFMRRAESELLRGNIDEAKTLFGSAEDTAEQIGDNRNAAYAYLWIADIDFSDPTDFFGVKAKNSYTEAINKFTLAGDFNGIAMAYRGLGKIALQRSRYDEAIIAFTNMQIASRDANNRALEADALKLLGESFLAQKRFDLALCAYNTSVNLLEPVVPQGLSIRVGSTTLDNDCLASLDTADTTEDMVTSETTIDIDNPLLSRQNTQLTLAETLVKRSNLTRLLDVFDDANADLDAAEQLIQDIPASNAILSRILIVRAELALDQLQFQDARTLLVQAQNLAIQLGDDEARGLALYVEARVNTADDSYTDIPALARLYDNVLAIFQTESPNPSLAREVRFSYADFYLKNNNFENAEIWYSTAIATARDAQDISGEGFALLERGKLLVGRFRYTEAIADFNKASQLFQSEDNWIGAGEAHFALADLYRVQVDYLAALGQYQSALVLFETKDDLLRQAEAQTRIGEVYLQQSRLALALHQQFAAFSTLETAKEFLTGDLEVVSVSIESVINLNMGRTRIALGQADLAEGYIATAFDLATQSDNLETIARTRQILGELDFLKGNYQTAIDIYEIVEREYNNLGLDQLLGELHMLQGNAMLQLATDKGTSVTDSLMLTNARIQFQRAFTVADNWGDIVVEIRARRALGGVYNWLQQTQQAQELLVTARDLAQQISNAPLEATILVEMGLLAEKRGEEDQAIEYYEQAVALFENVYLDIRLEPGQIAFTSENIRPYHRLVSLYASRDPSIAFEYAERGRARSFLYQLGKEQIDWGSGFGGDVLTQWADGRARIAELSLQITDLETQLDTEPNIETQRSIEEQINGLKTLITDSQTELDALRERVETQNSVLARVTIIDPKPLEDIRSQLEDNMTLLSYYIVPGSSAAEGEVYVFVVNDDTFEMIELPATPNQIKIAIDLGLESQLLEDNIGSTFSSLYDNLIEPVEDKIGNDRLLIIPHGALNSLPFGALTKDSESFLLDSHEIIYSSSATLYNLLRLERNEKLQNVENALIFGNPTLDTGSDIATAVRYSLGSLDSAKQEAETIASLLNTTARTLDDATETEMWLEARNHNVIHIAAHGVFQPKNPLASFLALASDEDNDGELQIREIYSLRIRQNEPMVVLSACDTAIGGESESDDIQSLGRAFLIAGARSVVGTLWKVDDTATQVLMERFYSNIKNGNMAVSEALREAQSYVRKQPKWSAPKYWAAFVLIGLPT